MNYKNSISLKSMMLVALVVGVGACGSSDKGILDGEWETKDVTCGSQVKPEYTQVLKIEKDKYTLTRSAQDSAGKSLNCTATYKGDASYKDDKVTLKKAKKEISGAGCATLTGIADELDEIELKHNLSGDELTLEGGKHKQFCSQNLADATSIGGDVKVKFTKKK